MIIRIGMLLFLAMFAVAGCQTPMSTPVKADASPQEPALTTEFVSEVPVEEAREAVLESLRNREWNVVSAAADGIEAYLRHRRYDSRIRVEVSSTEMKIYSDSWRVDSQGNRLRREHPEGWLRNIERDVRRALGHPY